MRKTLLATTAAAALVGFTTLAAAQNPAGGETGKGAAQGAQHEQKASPSGGAASGAMKSEGGASPNAKSTDQGKAAQGESPGAKPTERMGQGQGGANQRGAQEERGTKERGAQEQRGTNQRGAHEERGTRERGAQEQPGTNQRGAQEERGGANVRGAETGKGTSGASVTGSARDSRATSVKLSQDQRTRIGAIIGKGHANRVTTNEHFDVSVGARVPRSVHIVVLPEDIVQIVPEYRGFDYVMVGDEILIIDPDTLEIVAVIPA
jgi:hypothetical protein